MYLTIFLVTLPVDCLESSAYATAFLIFSIEVTKKIETVLSFKFFISIPDKALLTLNVFFTSFVQELHPGGFS